MVSPHPRRKVTMSPSEQDNTSLKNELEITSAVSVCLVKSGIRIAHLIHFSPFDVILAGNAVAPPKERPSLSKPAILIDSILVVGLPSVFLNQPQFSTHDIYLYLFHQYLH